MGFWGGRLVVRNHSPQPSLFRGKWNGTHGWEAGSPACAVGEVSEMS